MWAPLLPPLRGHAPKGISVAFSPDGSRLASGCWTGAIRIWDTASGELLHTLSEHHHPARARASPPAAGHLVSPCSVGSLFVWEPPSGFAEGPPWGRPEGVATTGQ